MTDSQTPHPVRYSAQRPAHFSRIQLLIRLVAFAALGVLGISFGVVFVFAYLALPAYAASRISAQGPEAYVDDDGPRVCRLLHWMAAVCAWAGLVAEDLPGASPATVHLEVTGRPHPRDAAWALWRVLLGLPSALVLAVLSWIGVFVWVWAALSVLIFERVGAGAFAYLVGLQRWSVRLLVYQAALTDEYPPFSFADAPRTEGMDIQSTAG